MLTWLDPWLQQTGPLALVAIAAASAIEYVFPPFPGDTATLFGGFFAVRSGTWLGWVFGAVMAGSLAGSSVAYFAGAIATRLAERRPRLRRFFEKIQLATWEERFRRQAAFWLVVNRFIPGIRGPIFFAAGASNVPPVKAIGLGLVSSLVWNAAIFALGFWAGARAERVDALMTSYGEVIGVVLGVIVVALVARWAWRRRRGAR